MADESGEAQDYTTVRETREPLEAELIALKLREAGIDARVLDQSFRQEPLPSVRSFANVRVLVPSARLAEAERVLNEATELPEDATSE
jgi:hypothetical protein